MLLPSPLWLGGVVGLGSLAYLPFYLRGISVAILPLFFSSQRGRRTGEGGGRGNGLGGRAAAIRDHPFLTTPGTWRAGGSRVVASARAGGRWAGGA